jgi:hypothetical protein
VYEEIISQILFLHTFEQLQFGIQAQLFGAVSVAEEDFERAFRFGCGFPPNWVTEIIRLIPTQESYNSSTHVTL